MCGRVLLGCVIRSFPRCFSASQCLAGHPCAEEKVRVSALSPRDVEGLHHPGSRSAGSRGPRFARVPCFELLSPCRAIC